MSFNDLVSQIYAALPELDGKLSVERVVYQKSENKVYISFLSDTVVGEKAFLTMQRILRGAFPMTPLAVRVASPSLGEDFLGHIENYKQVFLDFMSRNYPASASWLKELDWKSEGGRITLTFPDDFSLGFMRRQGVGQRLSQAVWDIFRVKVPVELTVRGDQEARLEALKKEREAEVFVAPVEFAPKTADKPKRERKPREAAPRLTDAERGEERMREAAKPQGDGAVPLTAGKVIGKPILGRAIPDRAVPMSELTSDAGLVTVRGDIIKLEQKELKGGELLLLTFAITDYTSSILCKSFLRYRSRFQKKAEGEEAPPITDAERQAVMDKANQLKQGMNVKVRGECMYDSFAHELSISVRDVVPMEKIERMDHAEEKRIELHMHTKMSTMDGLASASDLIARAAKWGHPAVAVTDHGVVQAFPEAFGAAKKNSIKLLPGIEAYLTDEAQIVQDGDERELDQAIVVLDFETTGLDTNRDRVIEIGAVKLVNGAVTDNFGMLVNPEVPLPPKITQITGITDMMLKDEQKAAQAIPLLMDFIGDCAIAAHNASFDCAILKSELRRLGKTFSAPVLDTLTMSRKLYPHLKSHKLKSVCKALGVSLKNAHRAVHDAAATAQCLAKMIGLCKERGITRMNELNAAITGGAIGESYHIILLAANQKGMENLNRMISAGHLEYFRRRPHLPRKILQKYREGVIVGSACEAGELFRAVLNGEDEEKLKKLARFYDYLEIQPIGNNAFLVRDGRVENEEGLRDLNKKIVALGEKLGIPVVATGDVHFMDPKDAICRAILQAGQGFDDCDQQAPLYFKTTEEMLEEFRYLGEEKCREVVILNPRKIADKVDDGIRLFPKHPKNEVTFQPFWPDAADNIKNMTWETAREYYGEDMPDLVVKRIEKELGSILGYGFGTLYNIAQKLVKKSLDDGYLVGSRGSVGSSFVATMCGITEVNPLPPHYRCGHCHKGFFDVDKEKYKVGVDLPDKDCPICGRRLIKDGFDIPFEVFLGFKGDKVPDIDLNFSGEYQHTAHMYVEELFGKGSVFRAGTIGTLADKTAYGYVSKYLEEREIQAGNTEKDRLVQGLVGVKRTTGQHPAGMVVVPKEYSIYQFTAIQHPADDLECGTVTTHYDFNSMHDILVKLDILGHDDPTMIHFLGELTGIGFQDIPLDDPEVMSLFSSPKALNVTQEQIGCSTGTFGVPEFGTSFVRGMLDETHPTTMEELIRISGLSHGTNVWLDNAQEIIQKGLAPLSQCICTRDDIMNYLISVGVEPKIAFDTMESVRKGKGLKPEMAEAMRKAGVPAWFEDSCRKIQYMFPKGHAVAYVTMALRIAWYKVHQPLAYYAAYFTVRGDGFDAARMLLPPDLIRQKLKEMKANDAKLTQKEKEEITALELVLEMEMRGFEFLPADLYKSDMKKFTIEDGKLRVPFISLGGLGEAAAEAIVRERETPFLSVEDLKNRAKLSSAVIDLMRGHGCLSGLPETSQVSLFNFL